jgi:UDP-3-O-[3-hydroxymyristoyl] N-acetylglucosamine deacetylase
MTRKTIDRIVTVEGVALHSGRAIAMTLSPAPPGSGIAFRRADLNNAEIPARWDRVTETRLGTVIAEGAANVAVIEHLMAAIAGAEIDDLIVAVDGGELPILDGDALSYSKLLASAGIRDSAGARKAIKILKPVSVQNGEARASLLPAETRIFDFEILFPSAAIGTQRMTWNFSSESFARDIAPARTFGFMHELEALNKAGLGGGASLENTLAIDGDKILNAALMRFPDEFVRHKILDAIGDLALAGAPIIGRFEGRRSGHALNNALLRALFADRANYDEILLS